MKLIGSNLYKVALWGSIILFTALLIFHLFVFRGIFPSNIVWGGRIETHDQMLVLETFSLFSNGLFLFIVLLKAGFINIEVPDIIVQIGLWVIGAMSLLNMVGNFYSHSELEKIIFIPVTLLSAFFSIVLALTKKI
jgi:hypothetical protein